MNIHKQKSQSQKLPHEKKKKKRKKSRCVQYECEKSVSKKCVQKVGPQTTTPLYYNVSYLSLQIALTSQ